MSQTEITRGHAQDRAKGAAGRCHELKAAGRGHELKYEAGKTGRSKDQARDAVKSAGGSGEAVEKRLGSK